MLKIGIVGINFESKKHLEALSLLEGKFEVVGYYEPNISLKNPELEELRSFDSYDDLLLEVDVIDIVSPLHKHYDFISKALRRSKHIFIQKPITESEDEARSLISLSNEADVKVQISSEEKFNPAFEAAVPLFNKPMFIDIKRSVDSSIFNSNQCLVLDFMLNDIDMALSVVKSGVKRISANALHVFNHSIDVVDVRIEFDNGAIVKLSIDKLGGVESIVSKFHQKDKVVEIDFVKSRLVINEQDGDKIISKESIYKDVNSVKNEFDSFYDSITKDKETKVSLLNGLDSLMVAKTVLDLVNRTNIAYIDNNN